jgi:hypothetical protein
MVRSNILTVRALYRVFEARQLSADYRYTTDRRHMLANRSIGPLNEGGLDLPAGRGQHLINSGHGAEHHAVAHADHASPPILFDHLRIEQCGQRHPAGLGSGACGLAAWRLHPVAEMCQQCSPILFEPIGEKQRHTARCQHLRHLMDHALGHGQRPVPDVDRQQQFAHRINGCPDPMGRA